MMAMNNKELGVIQSVSMLLLNLIATFINRVYSDDLTSHFSQLLSQRSTIPESIPILHAAWDAVTSFERDILDVPFSVDEVRGAIERLPSNKAAGPDEIVNEHVKAALFMSPCWTALFNECVNQGSLPTDWRRAILTVIPKGKGDPSLPTSWRGIAKKSVCYKLLSALLTRRLSGFLEAVQAIPPEQHGFRERRSTLTACAVLLTDIQRTLGNRGGHVYAVFVDFKAAFDTAPRDRVLSILAEAGVMPRFLRILAAIFKDNETTIDDGVARCRPSRRQRASLKGTTSARCCFRF